MVKELVERIRKIEAGEIRTYTENVEPVGAICMFEHTYDEMSLAKLFYEYLIIKKGDEYILDENNFTTLKENGIKAEMNLTNKGKRISGKIETIKGEIQFDLTIV